jgi:hypothetical protein
MLVPFTNVGITPSGSLPVLLSSNMAIFPPGPLSGTAALIGFARHTKIIVLDTYVFDYPAINNKSIKLSFTLKPITFFWQLLTNVTDILNVCCFRKEGTFQMSKFGNTA